MKSLLFAASLMLGTAALAQTADPVPPEDMPAADAQTSEAAAAPDSPMPPEAPAAPDAMIAPDAPMAPDGPVAPMAPSAPMQPSGVTVDDPSQSTGPRGVTQQGTDPSGVATPGAPTPATYPACSRTVTDSCVQTYERGRRSR